MTIAGRRVPSNHTRNTCGTHFDSFPLLVSKVANVTAGCTFFFFPQVKKLFCTSQRTDGNQCSSFHLTLKAMLHRGICNNYFSATQRCNAVAILFRTVTTLFQHCCPKNRRCKLSRVTSPQHFFRAPIINKPFHSYLIVRLPVTPTLRSVDEILWQYL